MLPLLPAILYLPCLLYITDLFEDAPVYSTCFYSRVLDSEGLETCCSSVTIAPMLSATAIAAAEKHLQDIYKQKLEDYKQERAYKAALN